MNHESITIRPVLSVEGARQLQEVQHRIWNSADEEILPIHVLVTLAKNGGLVLGAYDPNGPPETGGMVGFVVGWLGTVAPEPASTAPPRIKHCSHIAGVLPAWQGHGIGRQLKIAQRQAVLEQGITDHVTWTYDPLYRANGVLNIHSLGAIATTYIRNIYGEMNDALNAGVPTDRCQVDWYLRSPRVVHALSEARRDPTWHPDTLHVLPTGQTAGGLPAPRSVPLHLGGRPVAVPLPENIAAIRHQDRALLLEWRLYMRSVLEQAFAGGYALVDCVQLADLGWRYILAIPEQREISNAY